MIAGIQWSITEGTGGDEAGPCLLLRSEAPLRTFNTSIWGGGYGSSRSLINRQVTKSYWPEDPAEEMGRYIEALGIDSADACGMLTAAWVQDAGYAEEVLPLPCPDYGGGEADRELRVAAWVTAGLGNTYRAGDAVPAEQLFAGTVNIIVVADGRLSDTALAGAVITATEAKAAVFQDLGVIVKATGRPATGTTTDAVLVAATGRGAREYAYAGGATLLGQLIGRTVYQAAHHSCSRYLSRHPEYSCLLREPE
ncbi:adenosylcobinamide amidohydrolase [Gorillibacterium sp. sgz5001074]|uniref:adenosylcobinamide amidohydrolase n=1 Tax=Gorillibacterium sp. sgz5001074 TaxID=3446695 RepID=UPI003F669BCC